MACQSNDLDCLQKLQTEMWPQLSTEQNQLLHMVVLHMKYPPGEGVWTCLLRCIALSSQQKTFQTWVAAPFWSSNVLIHRGQELTQFLEYIQAAIQTSYCCHMSTSCIQINLHYNMVSSKCTQSCYLMRWIQLACYSEGVDNLDNDEIHNYQVDSLLFYSTFLACKAGQ